MITVKSLIVFHVVYMLPLFLIFFLSFLLLLACLRQSLILRAQALLEAIPLLKAHGIPSMSFIIPGCELF